MAKKYFQRKTLMPVIERYGLKKTFKKRSILDRLEGAAEVYFGYQKGIDSIEPNQPIKEELDAIVRASKRLEKLLAELSPDAKAALAYAGRQTELGITQKSILSDETSELWDEEIEYADGLSFHKVAVRGSGHVNIFPGLSEIDDALRYLKFYAGTAKGNLHKRPKGRNRAFSLRMWVINAASIWEDYSGQPFRVTYLKGVPKSDAACFCIDTLHLIDPQISTSRILTEMRAYKREQATKNLKK